MALKLPEVRCCEARVEKFTTIDFVAEPTDHGPMAIGLSSYYCCKGPTVYGPVRTSRSSFMCNLTDLVMSKCHEDMIYKWAI